MIAPDFCGAYDAHLHMPLDDAPVLNLFEETKHRPFGMLLRLDDDYGDEESVPIDCLVMLAATQFERSLHRLIAHAVFTLQSGKTLAVHGATREDVRAAAGVFVFLSGGGHA